MSTQKIKTKGVRATAGQQPMSNKNQPTREPPKLDLSRPSFLLWTADSGQRLITAIQQLQI